MFCLEDSTCIKMEIHQVFGQGEWKAKSMSYKKWMKNIMLWALKCVWVRWHSSQADWMIAYCTLLPRGLYKLNWCLAAGQKIVFSAMILCLTLRVSLLFWFKSICGSRIIHNWAGMANWFPFTCKLQLVVHEVLCWKGFCNYIWVLTEVVYFCTSVFLSILKKESL